MVKEQKQLKIPYTKTIIIFEVITFIAVVSSLIFFATHYGKLPKIIATQWSLTGNAYKFGDKSNALIVPIIMAAAYLILTIASKVPAIYGHKINQKVVNVKEKYKNARDFYIWAKVEISLMLAAMTISSINEANARSNIFIVIEPLIFLIVFAITFFNFKIKEPKIK